jgi:integrase
MASPRQNQEALGSALPTPSIHVRVAKDGTPQYEAKWRVRGRGDRDQKQIKRRLGPAWVTATEGGGWKKRAGRTPEGWLDERSVHVAAAEAVEAHERELADTWRQAVVELTVRDLAHEWHAWLRDVRGASASTVEDYGFLLRDHGLKTKRGNQRTTGRLMKAFGDRLVMSVTPRDVSEWLRVLDREGLTARNVNKHRHVLHAVFSYGQRADTYGLPSNPVAGTDKRREQPPAKLDYYEPHEVELLAEAAANGAHRSVLTYKGRAVDISDEETRLCRQADEQDGELFRVLLYSGLRIGEARALKWSDIQLTPDGRGGVIDVQRAMSANVEKPPKSWRPRTVPIPRQAVEALNRVATREHFLSPDDYVFVNRIGRCLDTSAIRRRYKAAREEAGLRDVSLHGLRHAAGSILAQGAGILVARDVLGHARVSTTNRYLAGKTDERAIDVVNAAFGPDVRK